MAALTSRFKTSLKRQAPRPPRLREAPLRAELLGAEQLERHARVIAGLHRVAQSHAPDRLLARLDRNEKVLRDFNRGTLSVDPNRPITPAAEWLLDNFYLIEEQIQLARRHLPPQYSRTLPRLVGSHVGRLRVYDIVLELVSHVDAQIDLRSLSAFIAAYQTVAPLQLGELWAIPIMLRLGLIENLARIAIELTTARRDRDFAQLWVNRLQEVSESNPSQTVIMVADLARSEPSLSSSFVSEFCQRLSRLDPVLHIARHWLEQRVIEEGSSVEHLVHQESQRQASDQVSVSHSIASLRSLSAIDWKEFVESLSVVEQTLRKDPSGSYPSMDFATRDRYRHVIESLARQSALTEPEMARKAIALAEESAQQTSLNDRRAHVGFYLIDKGCSKLERTGQVHWGLKRFTERALRKFPFTYYAGGIFAFTLMATVAFAACAQRFDLERWELILLIVTFMLGVSQLAVSLFNWLTTLLIAPKLLPRLDYASGIPAASRTMVVIPTILTSLKSIEHLLEDIEIHHLANRDQNLHFALLTDWDDAEEESLPQDLPLLDCARRGIESLNRKYALGGRSVFFLFHRPRCWNPGERLWMGYERKRGKLSAFNAFLRGKCADCFSTVVGEASILPSIKYVITLDSDTQLPREAARQLIGAMAHPLNRPEVDSNLGIVSEGYSLLQPRVEVSLPSASRSLFVRLQAGEVGIDPYTRAVSDVYQDLFNEGSFIGKGIYEVDAFERALAGRFPENRILSHDLLESVYARCGLISDVKFFEEYPSRYELDVVRRRRWIRGDWQILPWLLPRAPGTDARWIHNPISGISWWKIFDNLRRSLVPIALVLFLLASWLLLPGLSGLATGLVLSIVAIPRLLSFVVELFRKPKQLPWRTHLRGLAESVRQGAGQIALTLAFLPNDSRISLDAIVRTLWRMAISRRHLLEWQTSSDASRTARSDLAGSYASMWVAPAIGIAGLMGLAGLQLESLPFAFPLLALWSVAPWIAWRISQPLEPVKPKLEPEQLELLRRTARKTWHYFESFVTAEENWLPPDNFQEDRTPAVASRTSPTNIGLAVLANLAAHDFGYLSLGRLLERTQATIETLLRLERHRGHFYNWYDTRTLAPLLPLYVSTVDSGNLAGHLLTFASGLRELSASKILHSEIFSGLQDTLAVLKEVAAGNAMLASIESELTKERPKTVPSAVTLLKRLAAEAEQIAMAAPMGSGEAKIWLHNFRSSCEEHLEELQFFAPWLVEGEKPAALSDNPSFEEIFRLASSSSAMSEASRRARERIRALESLADRCEQLAEMDFTFLFDPARELFAIGLNVTEGRRDLSFYDLLASEARLCSYVAIAQGQVPEEHWFALGRLLVAPHGKPILVSWSGSIFEYLMPMLVMPNYDGTLLDRACKAAVELQIEYGKSPRDRGDLGIRFLPNRPASKLSISRLWSAGTGTQTWLGGGLSDRSLCHLVGVVSCAARSMRQSGTTRARRPRRQLRILRGD